jgi:hypothetical protein
MLPNALKNGSRSTPWPKKSLVQAIAGAVLTREGCARLLETSCRGRSNLSWPAQGCAPTFHHRTHHHRTYHTHKRIHTHVHTHVCNIHSNTCLPLGAMSGAHLGCTGCLLAYRSPLVAIDKAYAPPFVAFLCFRPARCLTQCACSLSPDTKLTYYQRACTRDDG